MCWPGPHSQNCEERGKYPTNSCFPEGQFNRSSDKLQSAIFYAMDGDEVGRMSRGWGGICLITLLQTPLWGFLVDLVFHSGADIAVAYGFERWAFVVFQSKEANVTCRLWKGCLELFQILIDRKIRGDKYVLWRVLPSSPCSSSSYEVLKLTHCVSIAFHRYLIRTCLIIK